MDQSIYFKTEDFVAFGVLLGASAAIGIYFAYKDRRDSSVDNYYFGGRKMNPITVSMSMAVTFISAIGFISYPAECYIVGNLLIWNYVVNVVVVVITVIYFIPTFRRLSIRTTYEYLELRFNKTLRRLAALMKILSEMFYSGLVVYVPSVALNAVTPLSLPWSIVLTAVVCTFYTAIGGIKAVIWTDALQLIFMVVGVAAIFIKGVTELGGFENLFSALERGERYTAFRFDYGIISRVSPLGLILGAFAQYYNSLALSQQFVQRYWACKTTKQAQWALIMNLIPSTLLGLALLGTGLVMYAYYERCDPVYSGKIASIDQGIPYLALELFVNLPGMSGLFVASIFSASLSTISSSLNSFSVVIVEDLLVPYSRRLANSERWKVIIGKILGYAVLFALTTLSFSFTTPPHPNVPSAWQRCDVVVLGLFLMIIAFAASLSKSNIMQLLYSFIGIFSGPLIGIFTLGFFFPCASSLGAMIGLLFSFALGVFMFVGSEFLKNPYPSKLPPRYADECIVNTTSSSPLIGSTSAVVITTSAADIESSSLQDFYNLNYNTFIFFGMLSAIFVGFVASLITGPNKASEADPKLFIPLVDHHCVPEKVRKFFRFGVPELDEAQHVEDEKSDLFQDDRL